jgi:hypothetical protein
MTEDMQTLRLHLAGMIEEFPLPTLVRLGLSAAVRAMSIEQLEQIQALFQFSVKEIQEGRDAELLAKFREWGVPEPIVAQLAEALSGRDRNQNQ